MKTNIKTCEEAIEDSIIKIGGCPVHNWLSLRFDPESLSLSFCSCLYEITRSIQRDVPLCMLFTDDIVLVDEIRKG